MTKITITESTSERKKSTKVELTPIDASLKGVFSYINVKELQVPWDEYQRERQDSKRAHEIAVTWNWVACQCLTVILRTNGEHIVGDGGTRLAAAKMRGDIPELPCMLHAVENDKQEAEAFRLINMNRDRLKTAELQKAEVFEGRDLALDAERYLDHLHTVGVTFDSLAELRRKLSRKLRPHTWRLIGTFCDLAAGRHLSARVFKGVIGTEMLIYKRDLSLTRAPYAKRLQKHGLRGLETAITAIVPSRGVGTTALYTTAICNLLRIKEE